MMTSWTSLWTILTPTRQLPKSRRVSEATWLGRRSKVGSEHGRAQAPAGQAALGALGGAREAAPAETKPGELIVF